MSLAGSNRKPALTAAASKIGFSRQSLGKIKDQPWQDRAWDVYDKLGPIYYMTRYRSAVARKMDYFAAIKDQPGDDPTIDVETNDEGEITRLGPATKVLEAEGGPELIRRVVSELMVHWDVPGEAYLVRFEEEPFWRVLSTQELSKAQNGYVWMDDDVQKGTIDRDNVFRVWKPHPRNHWQADSPTRHVLEDAEGLILSGREIRARSISRLPAGVWMIPDTVDMSPFASDENGDEDDFARELTNQLARPLTDPGSTASLVPWILTMAREDIAAAKEGFLSFAREWDISIDLREEQLHHVALGIDMPPELATGTAGSMNHWGSWWLTDEAVNMHVLPTVEDILDSLSINWFRPLLEAATVDPRGYVIWRDPSPATLPPDRSDVALKLYEAGAISGKALRRVTDFDEEDAPTEEELAARNPLPSEEETTVNGPPVQASADEPVVITQAWLDAWLAETLKTLQEGDPPLARAAVTAATRRRIVATELAEIDAELLVWVQGQADLEIERLTKLALSAAVDPLDESLLTGLASKLEVKIAEAQSATRSWLSRTLGRTPSDDGESLARNQGVQVIIGGILEAVRRKLFTPGGAPDPIETGAIGNITTPTQAIRHGLSLAGGGPAVYEDGKAAELIGNGQHVHDELAEDGFFQDGYVWKYGHPANTFEPHLHLDGKQFTSWDDPQLAVGFGQSWLRRSHYAPGDHKGCCCAFIQVIIEAVPGEDERSNQADLRKTNDQRLAGLNRPGIDDNPEIVAAAKAKFEHIMSRERSISKFLNPMAESTDGRFQHYGERVKFESSIRDKIWREMQADPSLSVTQAADRVTDGNRYTLMWEADDQFRLRHQQTVESFNNAGWETISDKNAWGPGDAYDGMNYKFKKGGDVVEVQFHTPTSAVIKDESHLIYSRARLMPPGPERDRLLQEVQDLWNTNRLHIPPGMENVGTQTWYDLS